MDFANFHQVGRPDLLTHFNDELDIEPKFPRSHLMTHSNSCNIDSMLTFVVSGTASVSAIPPGRAAPGINSIAPFPPHAANHIAMPVHQNGRLFVALDARRQQRRAFASGRSYNLRLEPKSGERRT